MNLNISSITYAYRKLLDEQGIHAPLGHVHQLVAAAFGYGSLAAYQADLVDQGLATYEHFVIDADLVSQRATELGLSTSEPDEILTQMLSGFRSAFPKAQIHRDEDEFGLALQELVDREVTDNATVVSEIAMTNGTGPDVYMPVEVDGNVIGNGVEYIELELVGTVTVDQDPDRVYYGDVIDVRATLQLERVGKRAFAAPTLRVSNAGLRWMGGDGQDDEPRVSLTDRLASELGLTADEADELEYDVVTQASDDDFIYGHVLQISPENAAPIVAKIVARHGSLNVEVSSNFFEGLIGEK